MDGMPRKHSCKERVDYLHLKNRFGFRANRERKGEVSCFLLVAWGRLSSIGEGEEREEEGV